MTVTEPDPPHEATGPNHPVAEALRTQDTFDRAQVAWLMSQAIRWGYDLGYEDGQRDEQALATVAAEYANTHPFSARETVASLNRRRYREQCDAAARLPRPGDFRGRGTPHRAAA